MFKPSGESGQEDSLSGQEESLSVEKLSGECGSEAKGIVFISKEDFSQLTWEEKVTIHNFKQYT